MAYVHDDFEMALSSAVGDDPALRDELRAAFLESLAGQVDLLRRSRCDANWRTAADRLRGLGASFHAGDLVKLAQEASDGAPGDPAVLRKLDDFAKGFSASS